MPYEYIGMGDVEYTKRNGQWLQSARCEESNIFAQITRMLDFDRFEFFDNNDDKGYLYKFKANVPFLAPDKWKHMQGMMMITRQNYLPSIIWAGLPDSSVFWQVTIDKYNKIGDIKPPVRQNNDFVITSDSSRSTGELIKLLKKRFKELGIRCRLMRSDSVLVLNASAEYSAGDLSDMLSTPVAAIYGVAERRDLATRISYADSSQKNPVYLRGLLVDNTSITDARLTFNNISQLSLVVVLKEKIMAPGKVCLFLNDKIVSFATLDKPEKVNKLRFYIGETGYFQMNILKASLKQPLPSIEVKKLSKVID